MIRIHGTSNEKITLLRGYSIFHRCNLPLKDRMRNVVSSLQFTFPSYIVLHARKHEVSLSTLIFAFLSYFERERVLLTMHYTNAKGRAKEGKEEKTEKKRRYSTSTYKKEREQKATWCLMYQTFCSLNIDYHQLLSVVLQPLLFT